MLYLSTHALIHTKGILEIGSIGARKILSGVGKLGVCGQKSRSGVQG